MAAGQQDAAPVESKGSSIPYMSFKGFTNLLDKCAREGIPEVFDLSYFSSQSGSLTAQVRGALRSLDLIDETYTPTETFKQLVEADDEGRKAILKEIAEAKYPEALALGMNATSGQLAKTFNDKGINGATVDKAIAFFTGLTEYVGIETSPLFKKRRPTSSTTRKRKAKAEETPPTPPPPRVTTAEQQKVKYVEMLMKLAESSASGGDGKIQAELLDRIERALGYEEAKKNEKPEPAGSGSKNLP